MVSLRIMTESLFAWPGDVLDPRRVVQCALSRVCGACGRSLGRPIAFVGTEDDVARNAFPAPPLHLDCAQAVVRTGLAGSQVVQTAGFEYVRPSAEAADRGPRFVPNSLLIAGS